LAKMDTILGTKIRMGQTFVQDTRVPYTLVKAGPCVVTQVKSEKKDGYWAVQLGFGERKIKNISKPVLGHLKGAMKDKKKLAPRFLREVRFEKDPDLKVGDEVAIKDVLKKGDVVAVSGVSKGKGFAGVVKRWKFAGGPRTHGQSDRLRAPGSIGQGTTPGRVRKGKKMGGRMGGESKTLKNLMIVDVDEENSFLKVSGSVPGPFGSLVTIRKISSGSLSDLVEEAQEVVMQKEVEEGEGEEKVTEKKEEVSQ